MEPKAFLAEIKRQFDFVSDKEIADVLGMTTGRVSQLRSGVGDLTARQVVSCIKKAAVVARETAFVGAIKPIVEMYPINAVLSGQGAKWELLDTAKHARNRHIREHLENARGIYLFFDSQGRAIYAGKTEHQNLWKELNSAFNRERSNHNAFLVPHPTTGSSFTPAWKQPRQPQKRVVYLHDTAHYFSAFDTANGLTPKLEAFIVRSFCNSLSNKKMEKL